MALTNTPQSYGSVARFFHWLIFLLVISQFTLAAIMTEMEKGPDKQAFYGWHKSLGVTILVIVILRLVWRFMNHSPKPPINMPVWEILLSKFAHFLLYALLIAMPISGYVMTIAGGRSLSFWGLINIPSFIAENKPLAEQAEMLHGAFGTAFFVLILLHALAALFHHYVKKDNTLRRMLKGS